MRVSRSGGWMSVISPHSNRERSRSSSVCDVARRPVGAHHDLAARLVERVEGVEELLLDPLLVLEELDVVDQQDVVGAVALLEPLDPLVAQRVDEVVHERLRGDVADGHVRGVLADVVRDRVQKVGLAEAGVPVDEERVVGLRRRLGDASAAAWAKRFDEPITNESNVYFGLIPPAHGAAEAAAAALRRGGRLRRRGSRTARAAAGARAGRVLDRRPDQLDEVALDPLAREVVRDGEHEGVVVDARPPPTSLNQLRKVFSLSAPRKRAETSLPEALGSQLDRMLHASSQLLGSGSRGATIAASPRTIQ